MRKRGRISGDPARASSGRKLHYDLLCAVLLDAAPGIGRRRRSVVIEVFKNVVDVLNGAFGVGGRNADRTYRSARASQ